MRVQNRIAMWLLLIACLVAATAPASAATESGEIRIMTFNVRVDEGTGPEDQWIFRRDRQVALIQEHALISSDFRSC